MNSGTEKVGKGTNNSTAKGILILILLIILAGAGGYFFGTYQKCAPIQYVPPGTAGAVDQSGVPTSQPPLFAGGTSQLKKKYWIHTSGDQHVGYAITVFVNGQLVDKFFTPGRNVEITKLVKPGENQINFQAKMLPESMNEHKGSESYYLVVAVAYGDRLVTNPSQSQILLNYKRTAADDQDYDDSLNFTTME